MHRINNCINFKSFVSYLKNQKTCIYGYNLFIYCIFCQDDSTGKLCKSLHFENTSTFEYSFENSNESLALWMNFFILIEQDINLQVFYIPIKLQTIYLITLLFLQQCIEMTLITKRL